MKMKLKSVIIPSFILLLLSSALYSQETDEGRNMIVISSNPNGAYIEMTGEYIVRGVTPLKIPYMLNGIYSIKAKRYGYEKFSSSYDFTGQNDGFFSFKLSSKTRSKAAIRSFMFPGWGQFYSDRKFSGAVLAAVEVGSVIYTIKKEAEYDRAVKDYDRLQKRFNSQSLSFEDRESLKAELIDEEKRTDDAYTLRQKWLYISATVWIYNVLDSIFFFNFDQMKSVNEIVPRFSAQAGSEQISLSLKWDF